MATQPTVILFKQNEKDKNKIKDAEKTTLTFTSSFNDMTEEFYQKNLIR